MREALDQSSGINEGCHFEIQTCKLLTAQVLSDQQARLYNRYDKIVGDLWILLHRFTDLKMPGLFFFHFTSILDIINDYQSQRFYKVCYHIMALYYERFLLQLKSLNLFIVWRGIGKKHKFLYFAEEVGRSYD